MIVIVDIAAPLVAYNLLRSAGWSAVAALVLSGVFPVFGVIIGAVRNRQLDVVGVRSWPCARLSPPARDPDQIAWVTKATDLARRYAIARCTSDLTPYRPYREDHRVRFPWQPREYARTCDRCGFSWRVPSAARRRRVRSIRAFEVAPGGRRLDRAELAREVRSISAEKQAIEAQQHCPECGADQFTQHAVHGDPPA